MSEEFLTMVKKLKLPLLNAEEIAALRELESQWSHWKEREQEIMPLRIAENQKAAYDAFLADPSAENEHRLIVLADPALTEKRQALLRRAFEELRAKVGAQAAVIIKPVVARIRDAMTAEHNRRRGKVEDFLGSRDRDPQVKQARQALDYVDRMNQRVHTASAGHGTEPPLQLAGVLATGCEESAS